MKNVLMIGPARSVKGGMTTVVDNYFNYGLNKKVNLKYIETINDKNKLSKFIKELRGKIEFTKYIDAYDIVHIHVASRRSTFRKCWYIKNSKKRNKKIVLHIHGGGFKEFYENECNNEKKKYIKDCFNLCDKIIVLSEEWKEYFCKIIPSDKIIVIENGVPITDKKGKEIFNKKILFLGRITKEKGIYDLINTVSILHKRYNEIELIIGGSGEERKITNYINSLNAQEYVRLLGWIDVKEKQIEFDECTYFCLPSYFEAMPISILEAMSNGCVTISSNVGGIPKIIDDKINGFLIDPGDIDKLQKILIDLFENKYNKKKISQKSVIKINEKFSVQTNIEKLFNIYNSIK